MNNYCFLMKKKKEINFKSQKHEDQLCCEKNPFRQRLRWRSRERQQSKSCFCSTSQQSYSPNILPSAGCHLSLLLCLYCEKSLREGLYPSAQNLGVSFNFSDKIVGKFAALAGDLSLVLSTQARWPTTNYYSSTRESEILFWPQQALVYMRHILRHTHMTYT